MFSSQLSHLEQGSAPPRSGIFRYSIVIECCASWTYFSLTEAEALSGSTPHVYSLGVHWADDSPSPAVCPLQGLLGDQRCPYYACLFWLFCLGAFGFRECR